MARIDREKRTIKAMIKIYCKHHHHSKETLCNECETLQNYAFTKLAKCIFGNEKPVCNQCKVHCYQKEQREKIKIVMRFSGPRMLLHHPILALWHFIDAKHK